MLLFSVTSANIAINDISLKKLDSLDYISVADCNHFDVIGPKATEFGEKKQDNGHYAVQGHSRSPILVPIESPYATSY